MGIDQRLAPLLARPPQACGLWYRTHRSSLKMCHRHIFFTRRPPWGSIPVKLMEKLERVMGIDQRLAPLLARPPQACGLWYRTHRSSLKMCHRHIFFTRRPPWGSIPVKLMEKLERVMGIEPTRPAWKAGVLPLNYTRMMKGSKCFGPLL